MQTITFYSYKGGVGRTLAVANTARYLSSLGQRVFCIDFDLEAPGLHHKFKLGEEGQALPELGLTDYVYDFVTQAETPSSLERYVVAVGQTRAPEGPVWLMPAGAVPNPEYWKRLAKLNWHDLFYSESAPGVGLFVTLKEAIRAQYEPDFLLIDARTGITEAGGVATTIMPDVVVCLLLKTTEHLEGARAVMRSIGGVARLGSRSTTIKVRPVLSRLPALDGPEESAVLKRVIEYLEEPADLPESTLHLEDELRVLHRDPELEREERLLIGPGSEAVDSALLQDYLRLCGDLVPRESITYRIGDLIANAMANLLEAPEQAERNLEALARYSDHPDAYRELLKVYRLRHDSEQMARVASHLWRLTEECDPLLIEVVTSLLDDFDTSLKSIGLPGDLVDAVWKAAGEPLELGLLVARGYESEGLPTNAFEVAEKLLERPVVAPTAAALAVRIALELDLSSTAEEIIHRYAPVFGRSEEFVLAWAHAAITMGSSDLARKLLNAPQAKHELESTDPGTYVLAMRVAGASEPDIAEVIDEHTVRVLRGAAARRTPGWRATVGKIAKEYIKLHDQESFESLARQELSPPIARELSRYVLRGFPSM